MADNNSRESWPVALAWRVPVAIVAVVIAITVILYTRSLRLPFYSDDLVQLAWLRGLTMADLWGQPSPYGYYRPLAFSLWIVWRDLGLPLNPAGLRLLNLVGHVLAAALVGLLAVDLLKGRDTTCRVPASRQFLSGICAAGLFAAYPFAYQVVPWVSAVFYPLVTALSVLAVLAYRRARHSRIWLAVCVIAAVLAPFAHENGMLVGLLVVLAGLFDWLAGKNLPDSPPSGRYAGTVWLKLLPLGLLLYDLVFLIIWHRVRGSVSTLDLSPGGLAQNATLLATGLSFPLAPLATLLSGHGVPLAAGVWLVTLVAVGFLAALTRREWHVGLLSATWFLVSIGPALVTMRPAWLADAPRFLYPASAGAALWWGMGLGQLRLVGARYVSPLLAIAALLPGAYFASTGVGWHLRGGAAIWDAVHAAEAHPDQSLLLVNLPNHLAPQKSLYPYFDGGAILLPPQVPPGEIAGAHLNASRPRDTAVTAGYLLSLLPYRYTTYGDLLAGPVLTDLLTPDHRTYVADYYGDAIRLRYAGQVVEGLPPGQPVAYFGDFISLWEPNTRVEDGILYLTLRWEIIRPLDGAPTVFVHIVDAGDQVVAQADGDPLAGLYPMSANRDWVLLEDVRTIVLPGAGLYTVYVGVWEPTSGQRLPARGGDYPDDRVPVTRIEG